MDAISTVRNFMNKQGVKYLLVNSTNEFLLEYNSLFENSRWKLTNFSGSTGDALVTEDNIYLFVDGRYHIQADLETNSENVTVVKMQTGQIFLDELLKKIPQKEYLGVFSKKVSAKFFDLLSEKHEKILTFDVDPLDNLVLRNNDSDIDLPLSVCGVTTEDKVEQIREFLNLKSDEAIYITDLDEVSYICNKRNFTVDCSAKITAKLIITSENFKIFYQKDFEHLENLLAHKYSKIYFDKASTNQYDRLLIGEKGFAMDNNPAKLMKAQKNDHELKTLQNAFAKTDAVVNAIREFIEKNDNLSEFDISEQLKSEFKKQGALGLSFNPIVAKDENSALAHYSKASKTEIVKDGSLILIDCGAYFEGGLATDITRVFVKGKPSELHRKIYTLVLKAFLNAYNYTQTNNSNPICGYEIDNMVRAFFKTCDTAGFVFNHGLGHGIGINVHENPPNLSIGEIAKTQIKDGMCFSIEPGLYKQGEFGIRLENSCYYKNEQINSFVQMYFEKKLIDFSQLTQQEKLWLEEFEVK